MSFFLTKSYPAFWLPDDGGAPPVPPLLLDGVPTAAAYSTRKLVTAYLGAAIQVRRSNDNALADIGFDSSGNLDTAALTAHVGANSGFIRTWYDQSGTAYDAVQATNANQPRIVNAGTMHTQNSLPAVQFNGSAWRLQVTGTGLTMAKNVPGFTTFNVIQSSNTAANQSPYCIHGNTSSSVGRHALAKNTSNRIQAVAKALDGDAGMFASNAVDSAILHNWINAVDYTAPNTTLYRSNASQGNATSTSTAGNTSNTDSLAIYIGCRGTGVTPNNYWNGHISELIWLPTLADTTLQGTIYNSQQLYFGT